MVGEKEISESEAAIRLRGDPQEKFVEDQIERISNWIRATRPHFIGIISWSDVGGGIATHQFWSGVIETKRTARANAEFIRAFLNKHDPVDGAEVIKK